jgi:hypothetical protein
MAMRTATMGNSLMGLLVAKSVVVAANCFSAGCKTEIRVINQLIDTSS